MSQLPSTGFLRLPQVLALIPVSRSAWWAGCKSGRYPKPVKLGPRTTPAWVPEAGIPSRPIPAGPLRGP